MALSRKTVSWISALIVISLVGLIILQSSLLSNAMELREQTFRNNVIAALNSTVQKLEQEEAAEAARELAECPLEDTSITITAMIHDRRGQRKETSHSYSYSFSDGDAPVRFEDSGIRYDVGKSQRVRIEVTDVDGRLDTILLDTLTEVGSHLLSTDAMPPGAGIYKFKYEDDTSAYVLHMADSIMNDDLRRAYSDSGKTTFVHRVINSLIVAERGPLEERLEEHQVDSVLHASFIESGIDMDYAFGVASGPEDSLWMVRPAVYRQELTSSDFRVKLFPRDFFSGKNDLVVYFPGQKTYLWQQVGPELMLTILFVVVIVFCFAYTIRTIVAQRRTAGLMVDFVNNMTHEFKTPISTVALACEAILRDDVISDRGKVSRFSGMIQNEVVRMRNQAEKILQMAALEEGDFELMLEPVNLHEVIEQVLTNVALHVENRNGSIEKNLEADFCSVMGDKVHLTAVIHSILDNANKYSPDAPEISVRTRNDAGRIILSIEDKGKGISRENQARIFDKYFRVSVGNVHDVKGFGLGLSYVRLVAVAHKGEVTVESELGVGTCLELSLPVATATGEGA